MRWPKFRWPVQRGSVMGLLQEGRGGKHIKALTDELIRMRMEQIGLNAKDVPFVHFKVTFYFYFLANFTILIGLEWFRGCTAARLMHHCWGCRAVIFVLSHQECTWGVTAAVSELCAGCMPPLPLRLWCWARGQTLLQRLMGAAAKCFPFNYYIVHPRPYLCFLFCFSFSHPGWLSGGVRNIRIGPPLFAHCYYDN